MLFWHYMRISRHNCADEDAERHQVLHGKTWWDPLRGNEDELLMRVLIWMWELMWVFDIDVGYERVMSISIPSHSAATLLTVARCGIAGTTIFHFPFSILRPQYSTLCSRPSACQSRREMRRSFRVRDSVQPESTKLTGCLAIPWSLPTKQPSTTRTLISIRSTCGSSA